MRPTYSLGLVLTVLMCSGELAQAQSNACPQQSLAAYITMRGSCPLGSEFFDGFKFLATSGNGVIYTPSDILVTPSAGGGLIPELSFSLESGGRFGVAGGDTAVYNIQYEFFFPSDPQSTAADLGMDPPVGNININEFICVDGVISQASPTSAPTCSTGVGPQQLSVDNVTPADNNTGIVLLNPPVDISAQIITMIDLDGSGGSPASFDSLSEANFVDYVPSAPEPSTIVLAAGGLIALVLRKRVR